MLRDTVELSGRRVRVGHGNSMSEPVVAESLLHLESLPLLSQVRVTVLPLFLSVVASAKSLVHQGEMPLLPSSTRKRVQGNASWCPPLSSAKILLLTEKRSNPCVVSGTDGEEEPSSFRCSPHADENPAIFLPTGKISRDAMRFLSADRADLGTFSTAKTPSEC